MSRELAVKQLMESALLIGRQQGLDSIHLIDVLVKVTGCVTEATINAHVHRSALQGPLTPSMAARLSSVNFAVGEPDESSPYLYLFAGQTGKFYQALGSRILDCQFREVPFCSWSPAADSAPQVQAILRGESRANAEVVRKS